MLRLLRMRQRLSLMLMSLVTSVLFLMTATQGVLAAPQPTSSYIVRGTITLIASPQAYAATPGAQFFDVSQVPLHLAQPAYYVVTATVIKGIYQYQYELVAERGSVVGSIELAINPNTHTQLIEVGVPTADSLAAVDAARPSGGSSDTQPIVAQTRPQHASLVSANLSTSGYYRTVWMDSRIQEVNEVKDSISFTYDGTYVNSYSGSDYRWWGPVWSEDSHSIGSFYNSNHTTATVWTHDHFGNSASCWPSYNEIYYSNNSVIGYGSGAVGGKVSTSAYGACAWELSYWTEVSGGA